MGRKTNCRLRFQSKTGCLGHCWVNTAATFSVWEVISKHCEGTKEEQEMLDSMFREEIDRKKLLDRYNFTDSEKEIVTGYWL